MTSISVHEFTVTLEDSLNIHWVYQTCEQLQIASAMVLNTS